MKPSLNSVIAQKEREKKIKSLSEGNENEQYYTETEKKLVNEETQMSVVGHLQELRKRIIFSVWALFLGTMVGYYFSESILQIIIAPAGKLYYLRPTEAFMTYLKVSVLAGFLMASPVILYEVWAFVLPALTKGERKITNWLLPASVILFFGGIIFAYYLVLPAAIGFFIGFATEDLQPLFSIGQYLDFVISFILPFGIVFELPLVLIILAQFNIISSSFLRKQRKIFIFLSFVIAAIISPTPDVFSQTMIALPMIVLYEASLVVVGKIMRR